MNDLYFPFFLFLTLFCYLQCQDELDESCTDFNLHWHLATKTPYFKRHASPAHDALPIEENDINEEYEVAHVDALYRHGSRYPGKGKLAQWKGILNKLVTCEPSSELNIILKNWSRLFPQNLNYSLHPNGWQEMQVLASESKNMFDWLYRRIFHNHKIGAYDDLQNCLKFRECKFSPEELTGKIISYGGINMIIDPQKMRAFDKCENGRMLNTMRKKEHVRSQSFCEEKDLYVKYVKQNKSAIREYNKFLNSTVFNDIKTSFSNHFSGCCLNSTETFSLYQLCSFLLALHGNKVICNYFTADDMKAMEYAADLRHFYTTGYGHPINYQLSCGLLYDIISKLEKAKNAIVNENLSPSVTLRFGHAETLVPLLCLLDFFKDQVPLTADSYRMHRDARLFRTGSFSSFAANIIFVLYKGKDNCDLPLKLAVIVSSHYVKLPVDGGCHFCDYTLALNYFHSLLGRFKCATVCRKTAAHSEL